MKESMVDVDMETETRKEERYCGLLTHMT